MPVLTTTLSVFLAFAVALLALIWFNRQISLLLQEVIYLLTGSADMAMVMLFLVFLPGILLHEAAHWIVAKLLGLKTGKFRVWPKKQGKYIGMGSVNVSSGGVLMDSLVGMAPLMVGSILIAFIGAQALETPQITAAWEQGMWSGGLAAVVQALEQPDGLLWAYLTFVVANAMMPSASDREPVKPLLLYIGIAALLYFLLDLPSTYVTSVLKWLVAPFQLLTSALFFTLILDIILLFLLYLAQILLLSVHFPQS